MSKRTVVPRKSNPPKARRATRTAQDQDKVAWAFPSELTALEPILSHEVISARAYELFLARGGEHGNDLGDWFQAEAELRDERGVE
jgi:hypothetical protein